MRFYLKPVQPFRLDMTAWCLRRLPVNEIDRWDGGVYSRVVTVGENPVLVAVREVAGGGNPKIEVTADTGRQGEKKAIAQALDRLLGLDKDMRGFVRAAGRNADLKKLVRRHAGLKPPQMPTVFEALVNGYACQQISLHVGLTLLNRLANRFGRAVGNRHAFPLPEDLAHARIAQLREMGFSTTKAESIIFVARSIAKGELDLESLRGRSDAQAIDFFLQLPGVGPWTAQYACLRGLGRLDIFPTQDVGGQERLKLWMDLPSRPNSDATARLIKRFTPNRGMLYFLLLSAFQAQKGFFSVK